MAKLGIANCGASCGGMEMDMGMTGRRELRRHSVETNCAERQQKKSTLTKIGWCYPDVFFFFLFFFRLFLFSLLSFFSFMLCHSPYFMLFPFPQVFFSRILFFPIFFPILFFPFIFPFSSFHAFFLLFFSHFFPFFHPISARNMLGQGILRCFFFIRRDQSRD